MKFSPNSFNMGAAATLACIALPNYLHKCTGNKKIQNEIHTTTNISVKDFAKIEKGVEKGTITWEHALDSLKAESKIQKSYFEGAQMVRDSIKTATKVAKAIK